MQEINEDSKLVEGLKKIKTIAKATRTLVNLNSFERSESVVGKKIQIELGPTVALTKSPGLQDRRRSQSCGALQSPALAVPAASCADRARVTSTCSLDGSVNVRVASFYTSCEPELPEEPAKADSPERPEEPAKAHSAELPEEPAIAHSPERPEEAAQTHSRQQSPEAAVDPDAAKEEPAPWDAEEDAAKAGSLSGEANEPLSQAQKPGGVEKLGDWGILLPAMINVVPGIEAAKLARAETPSLVLSGQDDTPDEPPDCFPQSIMKRCGCWGTAKCCEPLCLRWRAGRAALLRVVKHPAFEWSILFLIFGSSITLCFEDIHLEENPRLMAILRWTNMAFAILFAIEMIIKWFALGLRYYFSSVWTALDFVIVMVSIVSVAVEDSANLSALRSLRTLRALRPLRAISRWQGMKVRQ